MFKTKQSFRNAEPGQEGAGGATQNTPSATVTPAAGAPAAVDVQAQINQALTKQQEQFNAQFKEATGHNDLKEYAEAQLKQQGKLQELADAKGAEALSYKTRYEQAAINSALLAAATDAVDPALIKDLLAGKAVVDGQDTVTIDGKPVAEAVKQLLTDKPFLAKAQGGTGSGAPQQTGGGKQIARAEFDRMNPTDQMAHVKNGGAVV